MADSFVSGIANSLLGKLASYAIEEASRAYGVYNEMQRIKDTLSIVRGLLLDAEEKKDQRHGLREWLRQIQNICSDAEDVLDGFEFQDMRKQVVKASGSTRMKLQHFFSSHNPLVFRLRMVHRIKYIKERLDKVAADGVRFGLVRIDVDPRDRREMTHSQVDASEVIGRENDRENIFQLLRQSHDKSLSVISIVGIGGLGKTTLGKLVFNDKRMDELFPLKMWVCVSNEFDTRQILIDIVNSASAPSSDSALARQRETSHLATEQLVSHLRHKLSGKKFLLVLDDLWNVDRAKWSEMKHLLKVGAVGSKILVTTRSNSVASMMGTMYVLKELSPKDCLSLLVKWAFEEGEQEKYPNLVEIGKEIVKKCRGVPLAVRTLASSLFSRHDLNRWEFIRDHDIWNLEQNRDDILPALKLSYDHMSPHLKQCFAYFSLFPRNYPFFSDEISCVWVALGLVQPRGGSERLEDIAREYIDELHSRSFLLDFQDVGHFYRFKVHDLIYDLALYVAREEFLVLDSHTRRIPQQARHLSILEKDSLDHVLFPKSRSVRAILFPIRGVGLDSESLLDTWISRYKYLRFLDLSDSLVETLPNSIGKLEHLHALNLSHNRKIKRLPHSICKLHNLQALLLDGCTELETLPKGLGKLINLQRMHVTTKQSVLPENEFASLNNLHTLMFRNCGNLKILFSGAQQLTSLETLCVRSCGSLESLPLHTFPKLRSLLLGDCAMLNLSLNNESPIQGLRIKHLELSDFPGLLTLPPWFAGVTDTLDALLLRNLPNLKMFPEGLPTMTHLKGLHMIGCPQLFSFPWDLHRLTNLESLVIYGCPELSRKRLPPFFEYNWNFIADIKYVLIRES